MSSSFSPFWPLGSLFPTDMPAPAAPSASAPSLPISNGAVPVAGQSSASLAAIGALPVSHGAGPANMGISTASPPMTSGPVGVMSAPSGVGGISLPAPLLASGGGLQATMSSSSLSATVGIPSSHVPLPPAAEVQQPLPFEDPQLLTAYFYPAQRWTSGGSQAKGTNWWCDAFGPYQIEQVDGASMVRGVGPFYMRRQKPGDRQYICSHYKKKPSPCKAMATLKDDGTFIRRRYMHNHFPEPVMPELRSGTPYPPYPHHLPPPSFEQVASITLGPRYVAKDPVLEEFDTFIKMWDTEKNEMKEVKITAENCAEIARTAKGVEVNGKMVYHCPVESCDRMYTQRASVVLHMQMHVRGKRCKYARVAEKLCPLCREDQGTHAALVRHIVDEHDTRIECTEHEFETADDFRTWKLRTEQETLSSFRCRRKPYGNKGVKGWYDCCRTGSTHAEKEGARLRRVGVECPATMIVGETNGRITVTYWRTHIGHTPSIIDLRFTPEQRQWMQEMIDKGHKVNSLIAQGAKLYLGGPLTRLNCLTQQQIFNVFKKFDGKPKDIDVKIHHYDYGNIDQIRVALAKTIRDGLDRQSTIGQKRRLQRKAQRDGGRNEPGEPRDVEDMEEEELRSDEEMSGEEPMDDIDDSKGVDGREINRTIDRLQGRHKRRRMTDDGVEETPLSEQEEDNEEQQDEEDIDNKYHGCNQHDDRLVLAQDVMLEKDTGCYYVLSRVYPRKKKEAAPGVRARGGEITHVVFPRKAAHEKCDLICEQCQVCVHRYGCTCKAYMLLDKMCKHIHRVASCVGPPLAKFIDSENVIEDTIGMPEALRRLRRINYRERMKDLMPLADELIELLKSDHNVDLDQLEELLRSGLALMRTSKPIQKTRDDEARGGAQPMEARKAWELRCCPKLPRPRNFAFITASDWRMYQSKLEDELASGTTVTKTKVDTDVKEEIVDEVLMPSSNKDSASELPNPVTSPNLPVGSGRRKQTLRGVPAPGTLVRKTKPYVSTGRPYGLLGSGRFARNGAVLLRRPYSNLVKKPSPPPPPPPSPSPSPPPPSPPPPSQTKPKMSARAARHAKRQAKRRALEGSPDGRPVSDPEPEEPPASSAPDLPSGPKTTKVPKMPAKIKAQSPAAISKSVAARTTSAAAPIAPVTIGGACTQAAPTPTTTVPGQSGLMRMVPRSGFGPRPNIMRIPPSIVRRNARFSMPVPRRISQIGALRSAAFTGKAVQHSVAAIKPQNCQGEHPDVQRLTEEQVQGPRRKDQANPSDVPIEGETQRDAEIEESKESHNIIPTGPDSLSSSATTTNDKIERESKPLKVTIKSETCE
ncbi:hypothetical protein BIW11_05702 [Tropilaelaps mercedesae]|uniref:C2H2-type domain-containing protein n=1 Tax=Tropilaelaps mercedesae TaxID=418985 RepID=A0A1V9Y173_9ACAR|nr:hypothetical protein BIW11_05702 [Tropilaelaps mercedesae]